MLSCILELVVAVLDASNPVDEEDEEGSPENANGARGALQLLILCSLHLFMAVEVLSSREASCCIAQCTRSDSQDDKTDHGITQQSFVASLLIATGTNEESNWSAHQVKQQHGDGLVLRQIGV